MGTFRKSQHRRSVKHIAAHAAEFLEIRRVLSAAVAPGLGTSQFSVGSTSPEGLPFLSAIFPSAIQGVGRGKWSNRLGEYRSAGNEDS